MKITIEQHELGFIYRVNKEPHTSLVGIACSIGDALFEIAKTVSRMPNKYSAKDSFGLSRQCHWDGFVSTACKQAGCVKTADDRFGLSPECGLGTWHGAFVNAPHVERYGLLH